MKIFITGTNTNIGKTLISTWLCLHGKYDYFKPIQTGSKFTTDSQFVANYAPNARVHREIYCFAEAVAPAYAAELNKQIIDINRINLPRSSNLIVEGAGGVFVPLNHNTLVIDLIKHLDLPVIIVASTKLGTINHTLLTISALRAQNINILGVIMNGENNDYNSRAIEHYGNTDILAQFPTLDNVNTTKLQAIDLSNSLQKLLL